MATKDYYKGITVKYEGDTTGLSKALSQINSEMRQSQGAARALDAALKWDGKNVNLINDRIKVTEKQIKSTTERVDLLKQALSEAKDPEVIERLSRNADIAESKLKGLKAQLVNLNAAASAGDGLGEAESKLQSIGNTLSNVGQSMSAMGDKMTMGLTVPIVAAGVATIGAATTIDNALTEVRKTVDGTEEEYQKLHDAAIEYSKTNAVSAEQVLQVQALGAQLGYAKDELEMIGRVGSGMDIATDMNAEQATTEMAQFANITGMAHDKTENYASTIIALGNTMSTTESRTSSMAQRVAAAGKQVGMSEADILGLSAALSSMGIEAESGGTNISKIMSQIDKDVATGSKSIETWAAAAGMSADQFAAKWKSAPVEALEALFTGMGNAVEAGGNMSVMLEDLGIKSSQAVDVSKRLASGHEVLSKAIQTANTAWRENTALTEEVANKNDSLSAKFQMLQNRATAILEKIGKPTADALLDIFDAAQPVFDLIEDGVTAFADLDKGTQQAIVQFVALAAAAGPVSSVLGRVVEGVGGFIKTTDTGIAIISNFTQLLQGGGDKMKLFAEATALATTPMANTADGMVKVAEKATSMTSALQAAGTVLKGGIVMAGVALIVDQLKSFVDEVALVDSATRDLSDMVRETDISYASYSQSVANAASNTTTMAQALNTANASLRQSAEYNKNVDDTLKEMEDSISSVEQYAKTIKELSNVGNLSASQQEQLKQAVDGYNQVTGAAIRITDEMRGTLNLMPQDIDRVTEAYVRQAKAKAYTELLNEAIKEQARAEKDAKKATEETQAAFFSAQNALMTYAQNLTGIGQIMNIVNYGKAALSIKGVSDASADAAYDVNYFREAAEAAGMSTSEYDNLLKQLFPDLQRTGDEAQQAGNAMREAAQQAVEEQRRANEQIIADQQSANEARLREQQAANEQAIKEQQKANERANKQQQKANERENKQLQKQLDAKYKAISKQLAAEEDAIRKSNDARLAQQRKANEQQESALKKSLDARIASIKKSLDAEIAAKRKANTKTLKEAKDANAAETKAYKEATQARIAEMDRELKAKLKQIEDASGAAAIDARIKELQGESDAEDRALKQREQHEKVAELRMAVEKAKSRRKRADAEKELNDYLLQIQHEQREQERKDEIDRLNEQKSNIAEQTQIKKDALTEQYEQQKSQYEQQRADQLEREDKQREEDYERLSEFLSSQLDKRREAADSIIEQEREKADQQIEVMREQHSQQQLALKEMLDRELEARREAHSERLEQIKEQHSEIMESQREQQQEQLEQQREAQQAELDQMRAAQQAEIEQMRAAQAQELQALKQSQQEQLQALQSSLSAAVKETETKTREQADAMQRNAKDGVWRHKSELDKLPYNTSGVLKVNESNVNQSMQRTKSDMGSGGRDSGVAFAQNLGAQAGTVNTNANRLASNAKSPLGAVPTAAGQFGVGTGSSFASGIGQGGVTAQTQASNIARGVSSALQQPADNSGTWGYDFVANFNREMVNFWNNTLLPNLNNIGQSIANIFGHSTPKEGPLKGDDVWFYHMMQNFDEGAKRGTPQLMSTIDGIAHGIEDGIAKVDAAKTLRDRMRAEENLLAQQSQRWARVMEDNFSPDLTARYDANINYAKRGAITSTAAAFGSVAGPSITMNLHLDNVRIDSSMDIHRTAKDLAVEVVREVEASLVTA